MILQNKRLQLTTLWIILSAVLFSLSACTEQPKTALRIASSPWPGYEPLYLARDLGYLNKQINLFELPSSDITMESFRNKSTDLATLTLDETLELIHDGTKLKILLILDVSHGGDAVLVGPDIKTLADLKGKRISIVNIPLGLYMLNRLLDKAGLKRSDVTVFPMSESKQEKFHLDGKTDATITFEPVKTKLIEAGAHVIFDSSMIPNEIFDLLVAHEEIYQAHKNELCGIATSWFKSLNYINENKSDAAQRITRRLAVGVEDFDSMMDGIILPTSSINRTFLGGSYPELFEPARRLAEIMLAEKQLSRLVYINEAIDPVFANCYSQ